MKRKIALTIIALALMACSLPFSLTSTPTQSGPTATPLSEDQVMDQIQSQVIAIRKIQPSGPVTRALLTPAQLRDKVINDFFKDYTAADEKKDLRELSFVGLLNSDFNLHQFYIDLYSEQIAGYYDPETKDMYVVSGEAFKGPEKMTYAHEYTHVLQDQNYDLLNGLKDNPDYCKDHTEYCAAVDAMIEGDATITESQWFLLNATQQDQQDIASFYGSLQSPVYDSAPAFMKEDFLFPYSQGKDFVQYLLNQGKVTKVTEAYKNPPVDTEQILHPELYPSDTPVEVALPNYESILGSGWVEETRNVMGEWYIYLIFADGINPKFQLDKSTAQTAAAGWGGDTYLLYWNENLQKGAFIMRSQWDTMNDADQYWDALVNYATQRWGSPYQKQGYTLSWKDSTNGSITIKRNGNDVLWLIAPDDATTAKLINGVPDF
jgi:hypothetical protein